jgi:hypothetical protein
MQTFLPYADFTVSASVLDNKRLNKQCLEAFQIYQRVANDDRMGSYRNHPAVLMWRGYPDALRKYVRTMCEEYLIRTGNNHRCRLFGYTNTPTLPAWIGDQLFHLSHKVNLLRKDYDYYKNKINCSTPLLCAISTAPQGYYWAVEPVGKKGKKDRDAWVKWWDGWKFRGTFIR